MLKRAARGNKKDALRFLEGGTMPHTTPETTPLHPADPDMNPINPEAPEPAVALADDATPEPTDALADEAAPEPATALADEAAPEPSASPDATYAKTTVLARGTAEPVPEPVNEVPAADAAPSDDQPQPAETPATPPRELLTESQFSRKRDHDDREAAFASLDETILRPPLEAISFEEPRQPKETQLTQAAGKPRRTARIIGGAAACLAIVGIATAVRWVQSPRKPQLVVEQAAADLPADDQTTELQADAPEITVTQDQDVVTQDDTQKTESQTAQEEADSQDQYYWQETSDDSSHGRRKRRDSSRNSYGEEDERDDSSSSDSSSYSDSWWWLSYPDDSSSSDNGSGDSSSSDSYGYEQEEDSYGRTYSDDSGSSYNPWTTEDGDSTSYDHFYVYLSPTGESNDESGYSYDLGNGYSIGYGYGQGSGDYYTIDIPSPRSDGSWRWW